MDKRTLYKIHQIVLFTIYIALIIFFVLKCLESGIDSSSSSQVVANSIANTINTISGKEKIDPTNPSFLTFIRKFIGHYSYFVILGFISILFYLSFRKKFKDYILIIIHFIIGFSFAFISEFLLEGMTEGRGASILDVGIDSLGFVTLSIVIIGIYYLKKLKYRKKIEKNAA